jgi:uncharacterized protein YccT (UPF0319 family)
MRLCILLLSLVVPLQLLGASDKAVLQVPAVFNVLYVDGQKQEGRFFNTQAHQLPLAIGEHTLALQYERFFGDDDDFDKVKSEPFLVTLTLPLATTYAVQLPNLQTVDAAKRFARSPVLKVLDAQGQSVELALRLQLRGDDLLAQLTVPTASMNTVNEANGEALEQLRYWWQKASAAEREAFLAQILAAKLQ